MSGRGPGIGGERSRGCYDAKWVASMEILNRVYIGRSIAGGGRRWWYIKNWCCDYKELYKRLNLVGVIGQDRI